MEKKYVIIGAGNGGQSLAGDMTIRGTEVSAIYDKSVPAIKGINDRGGIKMSGPVVQGFAPIKLATNDLATAMSAGDVFLVCITSNFQQALAKEMAPYVRSGHTIVLIPGYPGSSLLFRKTLADCGVKEMPLLGETISFPYATRLVEPGHAGIKARKGVLEAAALPANRNAEFIAILKKAIHEVVEAPDALSVGLNNPNPTTHIVYYLLNMGKVEAPTPADLDFHAWGTPTTIRLQKAMDDERLKVIAAMGLDGMSYDEFQQIHYNGEHYKPLPQKDGALPSSSVQAPARFVDEDIPMGLIPVQSLARQYGVEVPVTDNLIMLGNMVRDRNFADVGTTVKSMGIDGLSIEELKKLING